MILTLVETDLEGAPVEVSLEALTFARTLSAAGGGVPVDAVVVAVVGRASPTTLRKRAGGVRRPHGPPRSAATAVAAYSGAGWASAILSVREQPKSVVVMAAGTDRGNELMAHVAARAGRRDGGQRAVVLTASRRSWSPARSSAARRWRR